MKSDIEEKGTVLEEKWVKLFKIGSGSYGDVYKGWDKINNQPIAIKKIKSPLTEDGIPVDTLREVVILKNIEHFNIIRIYDVIYTSYKLYLIFEFMQSDLKSFIESFPKGEQIPLKLVKDILTQILRGLEYLNLEGILHRDLKPQNVLLNMRLESNEVEVKVADFGLARTYSLLSKHLSKNTMTPLYRAPEVFLDVTDYSFSVDMWSVGCIFAEMMNRAPLMTGNNEMDVIVNIFNMFGKPSYKFNSKDIRLNKPDYKPKNLKEIVPSLDSLGIDLLSKMLVVDPENRITPSEALEHEFFKVNG